MLKDEGVSYIKVKVKTRSKRNRVVEEGKGFLRVELKAKPTRGEANRELIKVLSRYLGVSSSDLSIVGGWTSSEKLIKVKKSVTHG